MTTEQETTAALLDGIMGEVAGPNVRTGEVARLSGGATRQTWSFVVTEAAGEATRYVVQLATPDDPVFGASRRGEFALLERVTAAGVPIARPRWHGMLPDGRSYVITEYVTGESLGNRIVKAPNLAEARRRLPAQLASALARIHAIRPGEATLALRGPADGSPALTELALYERVYRESSRIPHPVLELALHWLRPRAPACSEPVLVHGDFRVGNILVDEEGLQAILDWELAHWGDPAEDLAWLMVRSWRFGSPLEAGGLCSREAWLDAYAGAGGQPINAGAVRWWEIFGNFRWAVLTIKQSMIHVSGQERSVELAGIGRRTAESEWEILRLLPGA